MHLSIAAIMVSTLFTFAARVPAQTDVETLLKQGNGRGATGCAICHQADGAGQAQAGFPRLAGMDSDYAMRQLQSFRDGTRNSPVMTPIAQALSKEEGVALTEYYEQQEAPGEDAPAVDPAALAIGKRLAQSGDWQGRQLPACVQCHGPNGEGVGNAFPALSGQHASYIQAQIEAWKREERSNDPLGMMKLVADKLSAEETQAVAAYFAQWDGTSTAAAAETTDELPPMPAAAAPGPSPDYFTPPSEIPNNDFGRLVRMGKRIFTATPKHAEEFSGNGLSCVNCHMDAGRHPNASPLWAAYPNYPAFRQKTGKVDTYQARLQGCFLYSMDGRAPPADSEVMTALVAYSHWMSKGVPIGDDDIAGRGYPGLPEPQQEPSRERGAQVFEANCAVCHGADGRGRKAGDGTYAFPPLWGPDSFNWGAGMHRVNTSAAFIKANMPLGQGGSLTDQQAWDVSAYMNYQPRPQDPRFDGDVAETDARYHDHRCFYGEAEELPRRQ